MSFQQAHFSRLISAGSFQQAHFSRLITAGSFQQALGTQPIECGGGERLAHLRERFGAAQIMISGVRSPTFPKRRFFG
jgi:hypothetical protein